MRVRSLVALALASIAVAGSLLPCTAGTPIRAESLTPAAAVGWINISATGSYGYTPPYLEQVPTDARITVTFTDKSDMAHTFTILGKEGWVVPTSDSPQQIDQLAYGNSPPSLVNSNVSGPGEVNITTFESPGPGWYEFICTVSGHFQLGMYGFVAFGMNLPSNLTGSNRTGVGGGLSFSPEDAVIIGAVVVLAVVGYIALDRRQKRARRR